MGAHYVLDFTEIATSKKAVQRRLPAGRIREVFSATSEINFWWPFFFLRIFWPEGIPLQAFAVFEEPVSTVPDWKTKGRERRKRCVIDAQPAPAFRWLNEDRCGLRQFFFFCRETVQSSRRPTFSFSRTIKWIYTYGLRHNFSIFEIASEWTLCFSRNVVPRTPAASPLNLDE